MIGREGALVLLLGAFSLSKWTAQGKRHEFIKHFGTTKSGGDFFLFFFFLALDEKYHLVQFWHCSCLVFAGVCTSVITHHICPGRELGGEAHNSPWQAPEEQDWCGRSRTRLQGRPPAHGPSAAAEPARGQAHGTRVASPGWDREPLLLTSAPKAVLYEQCRHKPSQRTSLVIPPSNLPTLFFFPKICKIRQGTA